MQRRGFWPLPWMADAISFCWGFAPLPPGCGTVLGRLVKSRRVQLIPRPQKMANNLQRQGRSARLVERSYCTEKLLAGWKFAERIPPAGVLLELRVSLRFPIIGLDARAPTMVHGTAMPRSSTPNPRILARLKLR